MGPIGFVDKPSKELVLVELELIGVRVDVVKRFVKLELKLDE